MKYRISRRNFIKTAGMFAAAPYLPHQSVSESQRGRSGRVGVKSVESIESVCEMCFWRCLISVKVHNGKIVKIDGNEKSPTNGEKICARGNAGIKLVYDPDRLKYPLKRVGPRGSGQWQRISWEEALADVGKNLKGLLAKHGPQGLALFPHGQSAGYVTSFFDALGCENICEASLYQCRGNRDVGYELTFGDSPGSPERIDLAHSKAMLLIGSHLGENVHVSQMMDWIKGLNNGSRLVVVDPRFSVAASKATLWLQIKPGTDTALLLAWMNYLITEELYDKKFVAAHCVGFDELKTSIAHATIEWAARITDLPGPQIIEGIRILAENSPHVVIHPGRHSTWYGVGDTQRARAMAMLTALLGAYGVKGSLFLNTKIPSFVCRADVSASNKPEAISGTGLQPAPTPKLIRDKWPFHLPGTPTADVIEATITSKPYPVRGWVVWGQNVLQSTPNPEHTLKAIKSLDYLVVVDIMPSPVTQYADIILPEATYLERFDMVLKNTNTIEPYVALRQPVIPPLYESRDPFRITKSIASEMGYPAAFEFEKVEQVIDKTLASLDLTRAELRKLGGVKKFPGKPYLEPDEAPQFGTPSGKIELYSKQMAAFNVDPVPKYEETPEPPQGYCRILYGRSPVHTMSRTHNNKWLHGEMPENSLWVHPDTAASCQLVQGDRVHLINHDGIKSNTDIKIKITKGIRADCVFLEAMFGSPSKLLSRAFNSGVADGALMTTKAIDPLLGTVGLRINFVKLQKSRHVAEV
jgi:thiosulfate reductase/polysulfide reductase chain A